MFVVEDYNALVTNLVAALMLAVLVAQDCVALVASLVAAFAPAAPVETGHIVLVANLVAVFVADDHIAVVTDVIAVRLAMGNTVVVQCHIVAKSLVLIWLEHATLSRLRDLGTWPPALAASPLAVKVAKGRTTLAADGYEKV